MPEYDFSGKVALVTGAAHGQGKSHAINYAKHGADVIALDIAENMDTVLYDLGSESELQETVSEIEDEGQQGLAVKADVSNEDDVKQAVQKGLDEFGQIDILGNNAGIESMAEATKLEEEQWDEMLGVNLKGVWLCAKHVGQHMVERGGPGKIINTTSTSGFTGTPLGNAHYVAAKFGVRGLTKVMALELADYDINVNAVAPTSNDTPMTEGLMEVYGEEALDAGGAQIAGPWNVFGDGTPIPPQAISEAFMWLSSEASDYVTGATLKVDAGFTAK